MGKEHVGKSQNDLGADYQLKTEIYIILQIIKAEFIPSFIIFFCLNFGKNLFVENRLVTLRNVNFACILPIECLNCSYVNNVIFNVF